MQQRALVRLAACAALAVSALAPVPAQSTIVSPVTAAASEGSASNSFPWNSSTQRRYMQVHSDVGGAVKLITKLAFRQNASTTNYTGTRAVDLELYMGHGLPWHTVRYTFDQNYTSPRTGVIARKVVNMGPQGQAVSPGPCEFTGMELVLDTPFPYLGAANALVWEAVVHGNTLTGNWNVSDADVGTVTTGTSTIVGAGCTASGRTMPMTHGCSAADVGGGLAVGFSLSNAPAQAPVALALGLRNPNAAVPGLCSNVLTDAILVYALGSTDAGGALAAGGHTAFAFGNTSAGGDLYSQMHALDIGRTTGIPVSNSDGRRTTIPAPNRAKQVLVSRLFNNAGGVTATDADFFDTGTVGYGLVTLITY